MTCVFQKTLVYGTPAALPGELTVVLETSLATREMMVILQMFGDSVLHLQDFSTSDSMFLKAYRSVFSSGSV